MKIRPKPLSLTHHSPPQPIGGIKNQGQLCSYSWTPTFWLLFPSHSHLEMGYKMQMAAISPRGGILPGGILPACAGGWDKRRWQRAVNAFTFKYHSSPPLHPRVSSQPLMIICPLCHKSTTQHTGLALPKRGPSTKTAGRLQVKNPNKFAERFVQSAWALPGSRLCSSFPSNPSCQEPEQG